MSNESHKYMLAKGQVEKQETCGNGNERGKQKHITQQISDYGTDHNSVDKTNQTPVLHSWAQSVLKTRVDT